jgi:hypothetical protein
VLVNAKDPDVRVNRLRLLNRIREATQGRGADSVVEAVVQHEACASWIVTSLAVALLGNDVEQGLLDELAVTFRDEGR